LLSATFLLLLTPVAVNAATIEIKAGGGNKDNQLSETGGHFGKASITAIFPQWQRVDLFSGIEYDRSNNGKPVKYSFDIEAASFGLRLKQPVLNRRVELYLALGGIAGKIHYKSDFSDQTSYTALSITEDSTYFISPRIGFGWSINLSKQFGLGIELAVTGPPPAFSVVTANQNTGQIEDLKLNYGGTMYGAELGVRYTF
jgi:hypothetical protein